MTERDVRKLEGVARATGDVQRLWRDELRKWQMENDENVDNVLKLNCSTRNLRTILWVEHHPIDLVFDANAFLRKKFGGRSGRQLSLRTFCQYQNTPGRRPLDQLIPEQDREVRVDPAPHTVDAAAAIPRARDRIVTGSLNPLEVQLRESERIAVREERPQRQILLANVVEPAAAEPIAVEPVVAEPIAVEPAAADPIAVEPVAAEPMFGEPAAAEPFVAEPIVAEPAQHAVAERVTVAPAAVEPIGVTAGRVPAEAELPVVRPNVPVAGPGHVNRAFQEISSIERRLRRADPDAEPAPLVTPVSALADSSYPQRLAWQLPAVQALAGIINASAPAEEDDDEGDESFMGVAEQ